MDKLAKGIDTEKIKQCLHPVPLKEGNSEHYPFNSFLARKTDNYLENYFGDHSLNPSMAVLFDETVIKPAAVLLPIMNRSIPTILLTKRATHLKNHSGQIAFPGGQPEQAETPLQTALRESWEEIGLPEKLVSPLGYLDPYLSGTNYLITPVVGIVEPLFHPTPNPDEVSEIFEVPLDFFLEEKHFEQQNAEWRGRLRKFYAITYHDYYIWGVTAGILRNFCLRMMGAHDK